MPGAVIGDVAAVILAGGKSTRMGKDKALIELDGTPLIEHVSRQASEVFEKVIISGPRRLEKFGYPVVEDEKEGMGPLAGIFAGLKMANTPWIMALPCDSPFIPHAFLHGMAGLIDDNDIVVPRDGSLYEPLHALYSCRLINIIEKSINEGETKIISLFGRVKVNYVHPETFEKWDPNRMAFFNINTDQDLRRAEKYLLTAEKPTHKNE